MTKGSHKKKVKIYKKTLPHRRKVLNRMFSYGKTKLCFTQVKTTGSRRISTATSRSDVSPETSGCRTSALWYFPLSSKLLSEVFHLFHICFVNWEKQMAFVFLCMAALGSCAAPEGAGWRWSLGSNLLLGPLTASPTFQCAPTWDVVSICQPKPWARQPAQPKVCTPRTATFREVFHKQHWYNLPMFTNTREPMFPHGPIPPSRSVWFSR